MSRYTEAGAVWGYRLPVVIDLSTAPPSDVDVTFSVPADLAVFWSYVRSSGADVRVTAADGRTALAWHFAAFDHAARSCTVEVQAAGPTGATPTRLLWLYWGNADVSSGAAVGLSLSPARTGYLVTGQVSRPSEHVFEWAAPPSGRSAPRERVTKNPAERLVVAVAYRDAMIRRGKPYAGGAEQEEPVTFDYDVHASAGGTVPAMVDKTAIRADDRYVYLPITGGTSGTVYTLRATMTTEPGSHAGMGRVLQWSAGLRVQTLTEGA